jgi:thioesterase domain-containing protein
MLAFEMAQQLNALGQPIGLLFMADSPGPGQMPVTLETDIEILAYLLNVGSNTEVSVDELRDLEPKEQLRFFLEAQRKMSHQMIPDWNLDQIRHFLHIHKLNAQAMWDYQPRIYSGRIIFFHAQEKDAYNATHPEQAWIDLAAEGLELIEVPGNHITMNLPPHVQTFADLLKAYLR